jgi:hypothetical protein
MVKHICVKWLTLFLTILCINYIIDKYGKQFHPICRIKYNRFFNICSLLRILYSVETTYGINSVISKQMTFVKNAEKGRFLFLIMLILSYFICS